MSWMQGVLQLSINTFGIDFDDMQICASCFCSNSNHCKCHVQEKEIKNFMLIPGKTQGRLERGKPGGETRAGKPGGETR